MWNKFECKTILSIVRTCIFYLSIFRYKPLTRLRNACKYCIVLQWKKWYGGKTHYCVKYHCYSISFLFLKFHCIDIMLSHPKNNCPLRSWLLVTYCDMPQNKMEAWNGIISLLGHLHWGPNTKEYDSLPWIELRERIKYIYPFHNSSIALLTSYFIMSVVINDNGNVI